MNNPMKTHPGQMTRKVTALAKQLTGAAASCGWLFVGSAQEEANKVTELSEPKQAAALASHLDEPGVQAQFERLVRKLGPTFPEVEFNEKFGTNRFVKVVLNQKGGGFDGIRFQAPASGNRELVLVFGYPTNSTLSNFQVLDMEGPMRDFHRSWTGDDPLDEFAPWGRLAEDHQSVTQLLTDGEIKAGHEYVIWFRFKDAKPVDMFVAINLIRPEHVPKGTDLSSGGGRYKALGFEWDWTDYRGYKGANGK